MQTWRDKNPDKSSNYYAKLWNEKNPVGSEKREKNRLGRRLWVEKNLEKNRSDQKKWRLKNKYGITPEDYNIMFESQKGCCSICEKHQSVLKKSLHVDHCHKTGKIRGLLCCVCNLALGKFEDDEHILNNALEYIKKNKQAA
jgi:hypothetical protein